MHLTVRLVLSLVVLYVAQLVLALCAAVACLLADMPVPAARQAWSVRLQHCLTVFEYGLCTHDTPCCKTQPLGSTQQRLCFSALAGAYARARLFVGCFVAFLLRIILYILVGIVLHE